MAAGWIMGFRLPHASVRAGGTICRRWPSIVEQGQLAAEASAVVRGRSKLSFAASLKVVQGCGRREVFRTSGLVMGVEGGYPGGGCFGLFL